MSSVHLRLEQSALGQQYDSNLFCHTEKWMTQCLNQGRHSHCNPTLWLNIITELGEAIIVLMITYALEWHIVALTDCTFSITYRLYLFLSFSIREVVLRLTLNLASCWPACFLTSVMKLSMSWMGSEGTIAAATISPNFSSGAANATASATFGWWRRAPSTWNSHLKLKHVKSPCDIHHRFCIIVSGWHWQERWLMPLHSFVFRAYHTWPKATANSTNEEGNANLALPVQIFSLFLQNNNDSVLGADT